MSLNKLSINYNKTEFMVISNSTKQLKLKLMINKYEIKQKQETKYLGVLIDKGEFTQYSFFVRFFTFLVLLDKVCAFSSALTRQSHTGQKFSEKNFLLRGTALFRNIALIVHTQNF